MSSSGAQGLPPWMQAEKISLVERLEIMGYKVITYIPVLVTIGLFSFLLSYYGYCFLYPSLLGDFYTTLGLADMWENQIQLNADRTMAKFYTALFLFFSMNLMVSIFLTITTSPGSIPDDSEWDMPSEHSEHDGQEYASNNQANMDSARNLSQGSDNVPRESNISAAVFNPGQRVTKNEEFTNTEIQEDQDDPREASHFDYKYLKSNAGPLFKQDGQGIEGQLGLPEIQPLVKNQKKQMVQKMSFERKKFGGIRMCQRCLRTKPDRCHHCSQCNTCILKMDHHCPWVANCIGFNNYKYFFNMILYASLSCIMIVTTSYPVLGAVLSREGINYKLAYFIVTAYVLASVFGFIITGFLCFHIWLISNQYTTIEFCEKRGSDPQFRQKSPYNRGVTSNFQAILGTNTLLWFLPMRRNLRGQGLFFEVRDDLKQATDLQMDSNRQLIQQ